MKTILFFLLLTMLVGMRPIEVPLTVSPTVVSCKMLNGQDRPFPCEFKIHTIWFMGKNNEVLAKSTANDQFIKLPKSKAISSTTSSQGGSLTYYVSVDFSRINKATFETKTYTLSKATGNDPISPGETTAINKAIEVSPNLPAPFIRPERIAFKLQLSYGSSGSEASFFTPIQLIQLENPVTFAKMPKEINQYRNRAEAWRTMKLVGDFNN